MPPAGKIRSEFSEENPIGRFACRNRGGLGKIFIFAVKYLSDSI